MSARRPVVGITSYVESARWGVWDVRATLLPQAYVDKVHAAGGRAVMLPPLSDEDDPVLDRVDALLLAGGADLDPALYGEPPHPETVGLRPDRDSSELRLLREAVGRDLPVLGICRGAQLLAVAHGGRLDQDLPGTVGHERHRPAPGEYGKHEVTLVAGTLGRKLLGEEVTVASHHHQGIATAGSLVVSGHAEDGTIEAVEAPEATLRLGCLWHPEVGADTRLFRALVVAATR